MGPGVIARAVQQALTAPSFPHTCNPVTIPPSSPKALDTCCREYPTAARTQAALVTGSWSWRGHGEQYNRGCSVLGKQGLGQHSPGLAWHLLPSAGAQKGMGGEEN